jgi:hydroxymethylpyrimidine/phosphomethylpyrimidine kinase
MDLNQFTVGCTDYDASVRFYETLGLTPTVDAPRRYGRFETSKGQTLSIRAVETVSSGTIVYFEVEDVDSVVASLVDEASCSISYPATNVGCGERRDCEIPQAT